MIDAELGILLRLTGALVSRIGLRYELSGVTVRPLRGPAEFALDIPAGTRVLHDSGGLLDEADVPAPVRAAVQLAGKAFAGAVKVGQLPGVAAVTQGRLGQLSSTTGLVSAPMPSICTRTRSPATSGPIPAGVPVSNTSPGSMVMTAVT